MQVTQKFQKNFVAVYFPKQSTSILHTRVATTRPTDFLLSATTAYTRHRVPIVEVTFYCLVITATFWPRSRAPWTPVLSYDISYTAQELMDG